MLVVVAGVFAFGWWLGYQPEPRINRNDEAVGFTNEQATSLGEQQNADALVRVKAELATAGIPDAEASRAAPYIVARLNTGVTLTPEAAAQAQAMGITPMPFSQSVIEEYSNWVQQTASPPRALGQAPDLN